jgi:hypothetical protein
VIPLRGERSCRAGRRDHRFQSRSSACCANALATTPSSRSALMGAPRRAYLRAQTRRPEATGPAARGRRLIASASRPTEIISIGAGFHAPDFPSPFGLHELDTVDVVAGFGVGGIPDRSRGRGERGAAARWRDQAEPGSLPPDHPAVEARRNEFFGEIERRRRAHSPRFSPALASRPRPGGARAAATLRLQRRPDAVGGCESGRIGLIRLSRERRSGPGRSSRRGWRQSYTCTGEACQ